MPARLLLGQAQKATSLTHVDAHATVSSAAIEGADMWHLAGGPEARDSQGKGEAAEEVEYDLHTPLSV